MSKAMLSITIISCYFRSPESPISEVLSLFARARSCSPHLPRGPLSPEVFANITFTLLSNWTRWVLQHGSCVFVCVAISISTRSETPRRAPLSPTSFFAKSCFLEYRLGGIGVKSSHPTACGPNFDPSVDLRPDWGGRGAVGGIMLMVAAAAAISGTGVPMPGPRSMLHVYQPTERLNVWMNVRFTPWYRFVSLQGNRRAREMYTIVCECYVIKIV